MKTNILLAFIIFGLFSCNQQRPEVILFSDLFETEAIDSVQVSNNKGQHRISGVELNQFVSKLSALELEEKGSFKTGTIGFSLYSAGQTISFSGRTQGEYLETHVDNCMKNQDWIKTDWIYFRTRGLNLDNF